MEVIKNTIVELEQAYLQKNPNFPDLLKQYLSQTDPVLPENAPEGSISFFVHVYKLQNDYDLASHKPGQARMTYRQKKWQDYLKQDIAVPARLALGDLLLQMYEREDEWSRQTLLQISQTLPLKWGPWKGIKRIFKLAEERFDLEMLGAFTSRFDQEIAVTNRTEIKKETLLYLRRRGWRFLKGIGETLPQLYPHAAVQFLRWYPNWDRDSWWEKKFWYKLWVTNHIFFHNHISKTGNIKTRKYGRNHFKYNEYYTTFPKSQIKYRAFPELWKTAPEPLLDLLQLCRADFVASFGVQMLEQEFSSQLRSIKLPILLQLGKRKLSSIQSFVQKIIAENPDWQKARFAALGLHELLLEHFLYSENEQVRAYAIAYAKDYAKDLPTNQLIQLLKTSKSNLHQFALQLLEKRDLRKEVGLEQIQELFLIQASFEFVKKKLKRTFRPAEIPQEWFQELLYADDWNVSSFANEYLRKIFPSKSIKLDWLQQLLIDPRLSKNYFAGDFVKDSLKEKIKQLEKGWIKEAILHPNLQGSICSWISEGLFNVSQLDVKWLKSLTSSKSWRQSEWLKQQKEKSSHWIKDLEYPDQLHDFALAYLGNTNFVKASELGIDWLFELLQQEDQNNRIFAEEYLLQHFNPADFASPKDLEANKDTKSRPVVPKTENPFEGKSFLFTGKLKSLTRKQAQKRVDELEGVTAKSVTKKLDFLVIGDEGSPLFTGGKKGSKLIKAEKLQASGSEVQIISETDWLIMISEGDAATTEVDTDAVLAGYQRLYRAATEEDSPKTIQSFAIKFLQARHPALGAQQSGKALKAQAQIPRDFYKAKQFLPLLGEKRKALQKLSIAIARYELKKWKIPASDIFALCESPHAVVRRFALTSLLGPPEEKQGKADHYFLPEELDTELVFSLCESRHRAVRNTGLILIQQHYDILNADQRILRLAESPDRDVRTQAVRFLWMRYRPTKIPRSWKPNSENRAPIKTSKKPTSIAAQEQLLLHFLRSVLFSLPPGRLEKRLKNAPRAISNSKAKVQMIDLYLELALQDNGFAKAVLPIFEQFVHSGHKSEAMACLVAKTRIQKQL